MSLSRFKKISKWVLASLLLIFIAAVLFINTDFGQNIIVRQVTTKLSKTLKARVSVDHVSFSFFNRMNLEGLIIEDQKRDTLIYAGTAQVKLTDWFIFKDKAVLNYVALENAVVHLNRTDSVWNYDFLKEYFSSGKSKSSKQGISFDLKKLELKNVYILKKDQWLGQDMLVRFSTLDLDANLIDISEKNIDVNTLNIVEPLFHIRNFPRNKPRSASNNQQEPELIVSDNIDSLLQWNRQGWNVSVDRLNIQNGIFRNDKQSSTPYVAHFDGRHIDFSSINASFSGLRWYNDTITTRMQLSAKERSGLVVRSMSSNVKIDPRGMEFSNMVIKTNRSVIRDYFAMRYNDLGDMDDFINRVRMEANFDGTEVDSDDLAFFAPRAQKWKKRIKVSGKVTGTVDDMYGRNMVINAGRNTILNGDISLVGLPYINSTFIDFKANDFRTTYADAVTFVPALRRVTSPRLSSINYLHFEGSFTGFIRDFVTFGTIRTNLGTLTSDLNMKLPVGKQPIYSGTIASNDFSLGVLINNAQLGRISFQGKVKGQGFNWNTLSAEIDGRISALVYNNYRYRDIIAKGSLRSKLFNGYASVNDSNARFTLEGIVDLTGAVPKFDFVADVQRINLKPLNISRDDYSFTGRLDFDFSSDNIDNFLGDAKVYGATITRGGTVIPVDSLVLHSEYVNGVKQLTASSNEFEGQITGDFSIRTLPDAFKLFLNKYYPAYIKAPRTVSRRSNFAFEIRTRYVDNYIQLIDSNIRGFNNAHISGTMNLASNQMELRAEVPSFAYRDFEFQNVTLNSKGDLDKLELTATIDNIIKDSLDFSFTKIDITARNDLSDISIVTTSDNKNIPGGNIKAQVRTYSDGVGIRFDSSQFVLNGKTWTIEENGELEFRDNSVSSGQLTLRESNQEIHLFTRPSDIGNWNDLIVQLKNVNIGDISPYLMKNNRLEGLVSGNINLEDPQKNMNITGDLRAEQLRLDDDSIGTAQVHVTYNNKTGELKAIAQNVNPDQKVSIDVNLFLKDPANAREDVITITPQNYPLGIVERFIGTLFTDLRGFGTGQLKIIGEGSNRRYVGKISIRDAGLRVKFTQCFYRILDTEIEFRADALDLGSLKLLDTITGNTATVSRGLLLHNNWKNMVFDIRAQVDDQPIQLLNTGPKDNSNFYGRAKGTGTFSLTGPQRDMIMRINAIASNTDSSYITLPSGDSRESGTADFLVERTYGRELTDSAFRNETNIYYDIELTATPLVNMRVVLDELTGDEIRGRGQGNLMITSGTGEPLSIRGRYNIDEGNYLFTFQSFFKKPFVLKEDAGNYIEWSGDPYKAYVKIDAVYRTEKKVSFSPILNAGFSTTGTAALREYVYVIAKLRGDLFAPRISFDLDFPPDSPPTTDQSVAFLINQLEENENELNKQVAFLVVFNSFAPSEATPSLSLYSGVDIVVNSISGFLSSQINAALNNFLSNELKIPGLYVNFSGSLYNPNPFGENDAGFAYDRSNFNISLGKAFFNDRFIITFEGNLDVPLGQSPTTTQLRSDFLKNVTTEWLINESGTLRATFFYRENVDFLTGNATSGNSKSRKYGASLAYRRDFNKLSDIFRKKKKIVAPKEEEVKKEGN